MRKCETPQILHHQIKCCGDLIVLKTNIVMAQVTVRPKMCIFTELEKGMVGPVTLHKKIHTTTVLFIVQIHILLIQAIIQAKLQIHLMILQMTGLSILALLGKNTTTIVEPKFHNGFQKSGLKENRDKKKQTRWQLTASQKIGITEGR
uniref:WW domain containing adaptor with coiled-coil n=1 Tax=Canis lupus familiaris TaxID=9615 RepID=A0A8P0S9L2_CANLF